MLKKQSDPAFAALQKRLSTRAEQCSYSRILDDLTSDLWLAYAKGKVATDQAMDELNAIFNSIPNLRGHRDIALARRAGTLAFKCNILMHNYRRKVFKDQRFEAWIHEQLHHPSLSK
jgi:hypothetical protein